MNDTISRDEAIDRMKAGLPCETCTDGANWSPTWWGDFDRSIVQFRKPPEPRRVAREWWLNAYEPHSTALTVFDSKKEADRAALKLRSEVIHVREVLPGDVVVKRMTETQARDVIRTFGRDDDPVETCLIFARAIGLIGGGS